MAGYIPKELFVAMRAEQEIILKPENEKCSVRSSFIVPAESVKFVATANAWKRTYNYNTRSTIEGDSIKIHNEPVGGVRIVGLSHRGNGGRAYKVIYPPNYLVDFREEVLLDVMYNNGVAPGGVLNGQYVWSVNNSQMKLIRMGSDTYKELSVADDLSKLKRISIKDLKPGFVYVGKSGPPSVFIGFVSTLFMKPIWNFNYDIGGYGRTLTRIETTKRKAMLWFKSNRSKNNTLENLSDKLTKYLGYIQDVKVLDYWYMSIENGHNARKEIGSITIPKDVVYIIRDIKRNEVISEITAALREQRIMPVNQQTQVEVNTLCANSSLLNMVPYGEDPADSICTAYERMLGL